MPQNRRRQRSVRVILSGVLLAAATAVVLAALLVSGALWLGGAAVVAWAAGVAAARIISNELAASRREHARDRKEQARAYNDLAARRAAEQETFNAATRQQVEDHAATIRRLKATLRLAEQRAEIAEQTADRNKVAVAQAQHEIAELKVRIAELEGSHNPVVEHEESAESVFDLESLAGLSDVPTVVDLLAWDDRVGTTTGDQRRQA